MKKLNMMHLLLTCLLYALSIQTAHTSDSCRQNFNKNNYLQELILRHEFLEALNKLLALKKNPIQFNTIVSAQNRHGQNLLDLVYIQVSKKQDSSDRTTLNHIKKILRKHGLIPNIPRVNKACVHPPLPAQSSATSYSAIYRHNPYSYQNSKEESNFYGPVNSRPLVCHQLKPS